MAKKNRSAPRARKRAGRRIAGRISCINDKRAGREDMGGEIAAMISRPVLAQSRVTFAAYDSLF
jgi:hypothetical protein